jgi:hypothetical protein
MVEEGEEVTMEEGVEVMVDQVEVGQVIQQGLY